MTLDRKEHWETVYRTKGHDSVSWYETAPRTSLALVEACGLDSDFGLSSDDAEEAALKQAMSRAATRTIVVTGTQKIGRRARHRTLAPGEIDLVVTDADPSATHSLQQAGPEVVHVQA